MTEGTATEVTEGAGTEITEGTEFTWIQTQPFSRLANRIMSAVHGGREEKRRGDLGGAIGDLIGGDS